ncbi:MAG: Rrf2 family transcriptional regulator [Deltaproteobacteria bacterium]|nr:Rrf2 family transcriptional regulator [Deltaproteobacteria bacterium]
MTVAFILERRPTGLIRPEDLPITTGQQSDKYLRLSDLLEKILIDKKFRFAATFDGRLRLAMFLAEHEEIPFRAAQIQTLFPIGRETARRLLTVLESHGLIHGLKGATGRRTTRYCLTGTPSQPATGLITGK